MALNIKDDEADRLARELAAATGESITEATRNALKERLHRIRQRRGPAPAMAEIQAIISRGRERDTADMRAEDDILGYDVRGLPQ